jgi:hypothetical protein
MGKTPAQENRERARKAGMSHDKVKSDAAKDAHKLKELGNKDLGFGKAKGAGLNTQVWGTPLYAGCDTIYARFQNRKAPSHTIYVPVVSVTHSEKSRDRSRCFFSVSSIDIVVEL